MFDCRKVTWKIHITFGACHQPRLSTIGLLSFLRFAERKLAKLGASTQTLKSHNPDRGGLTKNYGLLDQLLHGYTVSKGEGMKFRETTWTSSSIGIINALWMDQISNICTWNQRPNEICKVKIHLGNWENWPKMENLPKWIFNTNKISHKSRRCPLNVTHCPVVGPRNRLACNSYLDRTRLNWRFCYNLMFPKSCDFAISYIEFYVVPTLWNQICVLEIHQW